MKILILGGHGQVGKELSISLSTLYDVTSFNRNQLDITNKKNLSHYFKNNSPDIVINCAAYTKVDDAEKNKETAYNINSTAIGNLIAAINNEKTCLIHFSTDYVFSGEGEKYAENSEPNPINVYGKSKLDGDLKIISKLKNYYIFRISWVYGLHGNNFPLKIFKKLCLNEDLSIVSDQIGIPVSTDFIADVVKAFIKKYSSKRIDSGIYNITPDGKTSWFELAEKIHKYVKIKHLSTKNKSIEPILSSQLTVSADRPKYSVLDNKKLKELNIIRIQSWEKYLYNFLDKLNE